jgi:hypothetical protein
MKALAEIMTPEQLQESQTRASTWLQQHKTVEVSDSSIGIPESKF